MLIAKTPPPEVAELLIELGPRKLVLLEGDDDLTVFNDWYVEREAEVLFYDAKGKGGVQSLLKQLLAASTTRRVYGIVDRDFCDDVEVENALLDPSTHLFILRRYSIENYLLEAAALQEQLRIFYGNAYVVPTVNEIDAEMLRLCQEIAPLMAANWVMIEAGGKSLSHGYVLKVRDDLYRHIAANSNIASEEAKNLLATKEAAILAKLTSLQSAHTHTNGKFLLFRVFKRYVTPVGTTFNRDHLFRLLADTIKRQGLHPDIVTIVEERILK